MDYYIVIGIAVSVSVCTANLCVCTVYTHALAWTCHVTEAETVVTCAVVDGHTMYFVRAVTAANVRLW